MLDAIEVRQSDVTGLARERIHGYAGDPADLLKNPQADQFINIWPVRMMSNRGLMAGGGAEWTLMESVIRIDFFGRLQLEPELWDARRLKDASLGLAALVRKGVKAMQGWFPNVGDTSIFVEPSRLVGGLDFRPRAPKSGWGFCQADFEVKFRTDFTA